MDAERNRREHAQAITDLQALPSSSARIIPAVVLVSGVTTTVAHGLGHVPTMIVVSVPRGAVLAGYVTELRVASVDRTKYVQLVANGYGATITVDIEVK